MRLQHKFVCLCISRIENWENYIFWQMLKHLHLFVNLTCNILLDFTSLLDFTKCFTRSLRFTRKIVVSITSYILTDTGCCVVRINSVTIVTCCTPICWARLAVLIALCNHNVLVTGSSTALRIMIPLLLRYTGIGIIGWIIGTGCRLHRWTNQWAYQ